jgi:hypothetical protein
MSCSCSSSGTLIPVLIIRLLIIFAGPSDPSSCNLRIVDSVIFLVPAISVLRLRASALPLSFPGVYIILNLCWPKVSDYLTCRLLRTLVVVKFTKFLWSENIVRSEQLSA